jgi:hypothetical protein
VQVDPIKFKLKPPATKRLKPKCDVLLSTSAFKFNLHHYIMGSLGVCAVLYALMCLVITGRGLHSSTFWLNLSTFCGMGGA